MHIHMAEILKASQYIGVVFDRNNDHQVVRIFNPDWDWQLDHHPLADGEYLLRVLKTTYNISDKPNAMTLENVVRVMEVFGQ